MAVLEATQTWTTVEEGIPQQWKAQDVGDAFEGYFISTDHIEVENGFNDKPFYVHMFRGLEDGLLYGINGSYVLNRGLAKLTGGELVRLTYVGQREMGNNLNPAKNYRIEVAKA